MLRYANVLFRGTVVHLGEFNALTHVISTIPSEWALWCSTPMAGQVLELQLQPTPSIGALRGNATQTTGADVTMTKDHLVTDICYYSVENVSDSLELDTLPLSPDNCANDTDTVSVKKVENEQIGCDVQEMAFELSPDEYQSLKENEKSTGFQKGWTDLMADKLKSISPKCALTFKYRHQRKTDSKNRNSVFWTAKVLCRTRRMCIGKNRH